MYPQATLTHRIHPEASTTPPLWLWFNLLSLDAPAVAILWQAFLARRLHADVRWPAFVALGASVWLIYVADRLLDAFKNDRVIAPRHRFYRLHWWTTLKIFAAMLLVLGLVCSYLNIYVLRNGIVMASFVAIYFAAVHVSPPRLRHWWPKELAVGVLFSAGTCLATWSKLDHEQSLIIVPALFFASLCSMNCVAIEFWEWRRLRRVSGVAPHLYTVWMGPRLSRMSLLLLIASCGLLGSSAFRPFFAPTALSALSFWWLDRNSERLSMDALRVLADVALLTPLLLFGFGR
ncbi:MAG: hypothetical protein WA324_29855 [Bryobacteraceae bacterium]